MAARKAAIWRRSTNMLTYNIDNIGRAGVQFWPEYQKIGTTKMMRILQPFRVETREGVMECQDGYLAIDSDGWPYPIAADEQARIYRPA